MQRGISMQNRCQLQMLLGAFAEGLLRKAIETSDLYKHAEDYVLAMDTYYVESFNNVLNIFQDKRIAFDEDQYKMRSQLAVLHWNTNVDRDFTSLWVSDTKTLSKKNHKPVDIVYLKSIWNTFMDKIFA